MFLTVFLFSYPVLQIPGIMLIVQQILFLLNISEKESLLGFNYSSFNLKQFTDFVAFCCYFYVYAHKGFFPFLL